METTSSSTHTSTSTTGTISPPHAPSPPSSLSNLTRMGSRGSSIILDPTTIETNSSPSSSLLRKLPSSRFKGVVPQPNGRWGAQIYEKHQRVWLGTFTNESDAARAYDVAALRFRGHNVVSNSEPDSDSHQAEFLRARSKSEIVDMLRKHTYYDELEQSRRSTHKHGITRSTNNDDRRHGAMIAAASREEMFEKALTPSDVGKLNRLVIPKQHAEKHFPFPGGGSGGRGGGGTGFSDSKGVLLSLKDGEGKVWRFRYSYWNSSQSYVLTKGWSRFVKEKGLRAADVVGFQRSKGPDKQLFVVWRRTKKRETAMSHSIGMKMMNGDLHEMEQAGSVLRLFGVEIRSGGGDNEECCGGKRSREIMDQLFAMEAAGNKNPMVAVVGVL